MRITLKRSGGFGGIQSSAALDVEKLPEKKSIEIRKLIDASDFFNLPKSINAKSPQPDRFEFELTVEDDKRSHTVSIAEQAASKELKDLLSWLRKNVK
jgi:hypothetical protein